MERDKLIELLMKEREYHSSHPSELYKKFVYSLGASLAAVASSIYFTAKFSDMQFHKIQTCLGIFVLVVFILGIVSILIGLAEHSDLHFQQREKVEQAINELISKGNDFNETAFWEKYGSHTLRYMILSGPISCTPLITLEPDKRPFWRFHDRKFDVGVLLIIIAYTILIVNGVS